MGMNIFGRVVGGVLILLSFAWLATLAGIRPFLGTNQVQSNKATPVSTNNAAANRTGITSANAPGNKPTQVTSTTVTSTTVETNPRDAKQSQPGQQPLNAGTTTTVTKTTSTTQPAATTTTSAQTAPAQTAPVSAGW